MQSTISAANFATVAGVSTHTVQLWAGSGKFKAARDGEGRLVFNTADLQSVPEISAMTHSSWDAEMLTRPLRQYTSVELFAGAGGLALGMKEAGFRHLLLNENEHDACETLRRNCPEWNVVEADVHGLDFKPLRGKVDLLTGGFPCQAFSYAGLKGGLADTRGTLFFEMARAVAEIRPKVFMGENVKGLASHDGGRTLAVIRNTIKELGYTLVEPRVLKAVMYKVPQKRERILLIAIRNDLAKRAEFRWPSPYYRVMTLRDAFCRGELYDTDVPQSAGQQYPAAKREVMEQVPPGGDWRSLPADVARRYMGRSYFLEGGKTGMARRLSWDEPSLTLTCAPAQKQTERCHPAATRPLTVREYARVQTFPDQWQFAGNMASQYRQIGNAVPVNLAYALGRALVRLLNGMEKQ